MSRRRAELCRRRHQSVFGRASPSVRGDTGALRPVMSPPGPSCPVTGPGLAPAGEIIDLLGSLAVADLGKWPAIAVTLLLAGCVREAGLIAPRDIIGVMLNT